MGQIIAIIQSQINQLEQEVILQNNKMTEEEYGKKIYGSCKAVSF